MRCASLSMVNTRLSMVNTRLSMVNKRLEYGQHAPAPGSGGHHHTRIIPLRLLRLLLLPFIRIVSTPPAPGLELL
jgi:hypothetical protein